MNGFHVFPDKAKAYAEILRTLKSGGELLACFYIAGEQKVADWLDIQILDVCRPYPHHLLGFTYK